MVEVKFAANAATIGLSGEQTEVCNLFTSEGVSPILFGTKNASLTKGGT
jgi:hypothetical protein